MEGEDDGAGVEVGNKEVVQVLEKAWRDYGERKGDYFGSWLPSTNHLLDLPLITATDSRISGGDTKPDQPWRRWVLEFENPPKNFHVTCKKIGPTFISLYDYLTSSQSILNMFISDIMDNHQNKYVYIKYNG